MNTSLECMPCFMKMALREAQLACPGNEEMHQKVVAAWGGMLGKIDLSQSPPAIARYLSELIAELTGCGDLYVQDKHDSNLHVLEMLPSLRDRLSAERECGDPLALALEIAIIGNYIDRGVDISIDWEKELSRVCRSVSPEVYGELKSKLRAQSTVLILGDNTGEIVLDMLLVEELQRLGCVVTYAVRSKPVINDATMSDARFVGMTDLCQVVESGVDTPGTVLDRCTSEFLERMRQADVIISKGQGNFEALEGAWEGVYCAFKVKCKRVADDAGLALYSSVLHKTNPSVD